MTLCECRPCSLGEVSCYRWLCVNTFEPAKRHLFDSISHLKSMYCNTSEPASPSFLPAVLRWQCSMSVLASARWGPSLGLVGPSQESANPASLLLKGQLKDCYIFAGSHTGRAGSPQGHSQKGVYVNDMSTCVYMCVYHAFRCLCMCSRECV